ncbi:MAG: insulinase family protein [Burkholderiales bacterium]|uniref:M16 family metallopeptidase n=2 Tax=Ottowia TaxID=219181 RepID=A0ABV6PRY5_9BURK|nr:insulinase family protein [Burkholderiales bacterium]MBS0403684.1 insulinase family protein [Pseudomonadota bacterium]MBS0415038.1 insulinase family protein [Pseudomonadota bacterium]
MKTIKTIAVRACLMGAAGLFLLNFGVRDAQAAIPIEHWTQPSGAQVWFIESPSIPMLDVQIDFDAGSRRDPRAQAGLADATALMAGKGVTAASGQPALDENQLGEAWADLGADFGASTGSDRMSFSLRSLTDPQLLPQALALAARQLGQPSWPAPVWQRERERISAAIAESLTRPGTQAALAFAKAVYGDHPYGYETTADTLKRIDVADMQAFYARHIQPCRAKVSVVGAVSRAQADALVTELLGRLPAGGTCAALPPVPEVQPLKAAQDIRIPFQSAQAHVLIGQPGYKRDDPAFFALLVGNHILGGGGFSSRLMNEVREKRGLSYGAYSSFSPGLNAGAFVIGLQTRPDQAGEAVAVARKVVTDFVAEGPTATELKAAQDNLVGGFALRLDSNRKLLGNLANIAWNGLPLDYLQHWGEHVDAVTLDDIRAAFRRVLQPDRMVTVIVGAKP